MSNRILDRDDISTIEEISDLLKQNNVAIEKVFIGLPDDNRTLVLQFSSLPSEQELQEINNLLKDENGTYIDGIEQVALLYNEERQIIGRMIGGEMCGNGALVIGECIRLIKAGGRMGIPFFMEVDRNKIQLRTAINSSGYNILRVPNLIRNVSKLSETLYRVEESGIAYIAEVTEVVNPAKAINQWRERVGDATLVEEAKNVMATNGIVNRPGGLIKLFVNTSSREYGIIPIVIIPNISEMVESGCFTGTAAAAEVIKRLEESYTNRTGSIQIRQPSGNSYVYYLNVTGAVVLGNKPKIISTC